MSRTIVRDMNQWDLFLGCKGWLSRLVPPEPMCGGPEPVWCRFCDAVDFEVLVAATVREVSV